MQSQRSSWFHTAAALYVSFSSQRIESSFKCDSNSMALTRDCMLRGKEEVGDGYSKKETRLEALAKW
jgi:hypothetical protein